MKFKRYLIPLIILFLLTVSSVIGLGLLHQALRTEGETTTIFPDSDQTTDSTDPTTCDTTTDLPTIIDFQSLIDQWVADTVISSRIDVGVVIYDLDHQTTVGAYQADTVFNAASIYKLFYAYDGYREISANRDSANSYFITTADKGDLTLGDCLDLIMRESYNGCAEPLRNDSSRTARVEALISELDLTNTTGAGLYSTANDLAALLKLYWEHPDLTADQWLKLQDSMLNQPPTPSVYNYDAIDDWRQGLPAGFTTAEVYNKVGWAWNGSCWSVYDDAAIVVFPEQNRHYIVVALTEGLAGPIPTPLVQLGQLIETTVLSAN